MPQRHVTTRHAIAAITSLVACAGLAAPTGSVAQAAPPTPDYDQPPQDISMSCTRPRRRWPA